MNGLYIETAINALSEYLQEPSEANLWATYDQLKHYQSAISTLKDTDTTWTGLNRLEVKTRVRGLIDWNPTENPYGAKSVTRGTNGTLITEY